MPDSSYPLDVSCSFNALHIPQKQNAKLRAWQLNLDDQSLTEVRTPEDLSPGTFAVVWHGKVETGATNQCNARDVTFFQVPSNSFIRLKADSASAQLAIIGIVGDGDAELSAPFVEQSSGDLPICWKGEELQSATMLVLELDDSNQPAIEANDWVQPAYVITSPEGPQPLFSTDDPGPGGGSPIPSTGTDVVFAGVEAGWLSFQYGTESRVILCDFSFPGDARRPSILACTWRCPGRGPLLPDE